MHRIAKGGIEKKGIKDHGTVSNENKSKSKSIYRKESRSLVRGPLLTSSVITSAETARRADEAEDHREKGSEDDPVSDAEAGGKATVHDAVARHGKENDLDDPSCEGDDEREARDNAHVDVPVRWLVAPHMPTRKEMAERTAADTEKSSTAEVGRGTRLVKRAYLLG